MSRIKVKKMLALIAVCLTLQSISISPVLAAMSFVPDAAGAEQGSITGDAPLRSIGSLEMSEGKVVIQQNAITVLSCASDTAQDAELKGAILKAHLVQSANRERAEGIALFNQGFSVAALDSIQVQDTVKASDGSMYVGRIVDITPNMLRIQTSEGVKVIPTRFITDVKSTRAFSFSLPVQSRSSSLVPEATATAPGSYAAPPAQTPRAGQAAPARSDSLGGSTPLALTAESTPDAPSFNGATFTPTFVPDANASAPPPKTPTYQAQLTQRHPGKKALRVSGYAAFAAACVLLPLALCTIAKPPPQN